MGGGELFEFVVDVLEDYNEIKWGFQYFIVVTKYLNFFSVSLQSYSW